MRRERLLAEPEGSGRRLRVVHVASRYWPAVGGVESFLRHVATGMAARHDVTVLTQRIDDGPTTRLSSSLRPPPPFEPFWDGPARIEPLHIPVHRRAMMAPLLSQVVPVARRYAYGRARGPASALYALAVAPLIARTLEGADVMHMWGGDMLSAAAVRSARLAGVPAVITPFAHANGWSTDPGSAGAYRAADGVVALLEADAAVYEELGVPAGRLSVCGVCSPALPAGGGGEVRRRHGIDGPLILFLGVRRAYKGFDLLLDAAEHVHAQRPDATFAFVGPGASLPAARSPRILDVGTVDEKDKAAWLDAADLLCLPSESEIFPVSIIEAWSVGTPVLVSDLPTLEEIIRRWGGGVVARREPSAFAKVILDLLERPEQLREMGEAGRAEAARSGTVEAAVRKHEQLYRNLIATANGAGPHRESSRTRQ